MTDQWTEAQLVAAHREGRTEDIIAAHRAGQLRHLQAARAATARPATVRLGDAPRPTADEVARAAEPVPDPPPATGQLGRADLAGMSPEAILTAKAEGRLDDLLRIQR